MRDSANRVAIWNETVHYADDDMTPACGSASRTHTGWMRVTIATVTCSKCIAMFGADEEGHVDTPEVDEKVAARAAARAVRQAARP